MSIDRIVTEFYLEIVINKTGGFYELSDYFADKTIYRRAF